MEFESKELLGLAGEYAVASELCKRGIYAQLTLGHHKSTDILIESEYQMLRVQVKAKQYGTWPAVKGIYKKDDFLILVDFKGKNIDERPDFYILSIRNWKNLINKEKQKYSEVRIDDKLCVHYSDGWKGLNIKLSHVMNYKEKWEKIINRAKK